MNIVVIGGTGLLGSKIVTRLQESGHEAVAASPGTGVNTITGQGVAEALAPAEVVIDASNSPAWDDEAVMDFFQTSSGNLVQEAERAGIKHYVAMSIVGADELPDSGYLRAKVEQERIVDNGAVPFTIVRATQFFEFIGRIADSATSGTTVELPAANFQPVAADELASAVAEIATGEPRNRVVEVAGPEPLPMGDAVAQVLRAAGDTRKVVTDPDARYFGTTLELDSLVAGEIARLTRTRLETWLTGH
jgi:uncharacterized protein YbjT (DUF2867 family)